MASGNESIRVDIYDQSYNLRGLDAARIQKMAEMVDLKMRAVAEHTSTVDSLRVAVLAALNLADELTALRARYENVCGDYKTQTAQLSALLDAVLEPQPKSRARRAS
jgi:cell division protein ZapA